MINFHELEGLLFCLWLPTYIGIFIIAATLDEILKELKKR